MRLPYGAATIMQHTRPTRLVLALLLAPACGDPLDERAPGDRRPLTAACDDNDPLRCLLPWPSSTFTRADAARGTRLSVAVEQASLPKDLDDPWALNLADGFSRVTPLMTAFPGPLTWSAEASPVRLVCAQPDHPRYGDEVPLRLDQVEQDGQTLLIAFPLAPLAPNADYVVVVTDALQSAAGASLAPSRPTLLALERRQAKTRDEEALVAYHAPTRALLRAAGFEAAEVLRVWDFTTRSAADATGWLVDARAQAVAAVARGEVGVAVDRVEPGDDPTIALVVEGRLTGLPRFAVDGRLQPAGEALLADGVTEAPFRVALPAGTGDYGVAMYGHGTGGNVHDDAFDEVITGQGLAKVGVEFAGWTGSDLVDSLLALDRMIAGTHQSTAGLLQSLAHAAAIQAALDTVLGDALAAPELAGQPNPAAGRRPDATRPLWVGGSLAGTMGVTYASVDPTLAHAVVNVPGVAWTHWMRDADLYLLLQSLMELNHGGPINMAMATLMTQGAWDPIDGAVFDQPRAEHPVVFLLQESIGDPILPNAGSELAAVSVGAVQLGAVLAPIVGLPLAEEAVGQSAMTQFRVADTGKYDVHGFAARDTPAGRAAREQITDFFLSIAAGAPRISVPSGCPDGSCDFAAAGP